MSKHKKTVPARPDTATVSVLEKPPNVQAVEVVRKHITRVLEAEKERLDGAIVENTKEQEEVDEFLYDCLDDITLDEVRHSEGAVEFRSKIDGDLLGRIACLMGLFEDPCPDLGARMAERLFDSVCQTIHNKFSCNTEEIMQSLDALAENMVVSVRVYVSLLNIKGHIQSSVRLGGDDYENGSDEPHSFEMGFQFDISKWVPGFRGHFDKSMATQAAGANVWKELGLVTDRLRQVPAMVDLALAKHTADQLRRDGHGEVLRHAAELVDKFSKNGVDSAV